MFQFEDKVVLITGAGSGIVAAAAKAFARAGATLVVGDKEKDRLEVQQPPADRELGKSCQAPKTSQNAVTRTLHSR